LSKNKDLSDQVSLWWSEKICKLKYLKNNKAASADSITVKLLKNGGPQLMDVLEEVIQLAWMSKKLPESWTKEVLCPVYKKEDKLDYTNYLHAEHSIQNFRQSMIRPFVTLR
jgi:hypothetical protein